jgi:hypothetical protein
MYIFLEEVLPCETLQAMNERAVAQCEWWTKGFEQDYVTRRSKESKITCHFLFVFS